MHAGMERSVARFLRTPCLVDRELGCQVVSGITNFVGCFFVASVLERRRSVKRKRSLGVNRQATLMQTRG